MCKSKSEANGKRIFPRLQVEKIPNCGTAPGRRQKALSNTCGVAKRQLTLSMRCRCVFLV